MANLPERPSPVVSREFEAVARRATQFAEGLRQANRLPDDFPKIQVEEICKTLATLPNATTQGGRVQLGYANLRLPDVRGEFFSLDSGNEDGQPTRDEGVDDQFSLLIAAVATAIGTIDRESGKRPAEEPPAARYPADQTDAGLAATIASGTVAANELGALGQKLAEITKPESSRADLLRRQVADGRGLVVLARTELMFREVVPQWTRKLGKAIEKIPEGLDITAKLIDKGVDIVVLFHNQWSKLEQDMQELVIENIRQFGTNLRATANILRGDQIVVGDTNPPTTPPPDFDMHKVKAMILAGHPIPPDWVPWVTELDLIGEKHFTDATPLTGLSNLRTLNLKETQITDAAPLAGLSNLQTLNLWRTKITDATPLARLSNLQTLNLMGTHITDVTPLAGLSKLQSLNLWTTQITDAAPLAGLRNLQTLNLMGTQITDATPLAGLSNLQTLNLMGTQITDATPLAGLSNLQTLDLMGTQITDAAPLAGLRNLQTLNLWGTQITDATPLAGLRKLEMLNLRGTKITDATPLAGLVNLQTLNLRGTKINDVAPLASLPNLSWIDVETLKRAKAFLPQLREGWRVENPESVGWYELRRDVPRGGGG